MPFVKVYLVVAIIFAILFLSACGSESPAGGPLEATVPKGPPPKKLVIEDIKVGSGAEPKARDEIAIQYKAVAYRTGREFDARPRSEPFLFRPGMGRVMQGMDRGVMGMKVGGRRELIIPPYLTEEELGRPETLIYAIELLGVEPAAEFERRFNNLEPSALLKKF
jgi:peptidylprolyl isomerase